MIKMESICSYFDIIDNGTELKSNSYSYQNNSDIKKLKLKIIPVKSPVSCVSRELFTSWGKDAFLRTISPIKNVQFEHYFSK